MYPPFFALGSTLTFTLMCFQSVYQELERCFVLGRVVLRYSDAEIDYPTEGSVLFRYVICDCSGDKHIRVGLSVRIGKGEHVLKEVERRIEWVPFLVAFEAFFSVSCKRG